MCVQRGFQSLEVRENKMEKKPQIHMSVVFCCVAKHKEGLIKDLYFIFWFIAGRIWLNLPSDDCPTFSTSFK